VSPLNGAFAVANGLLKTVTKGLLVTQNVDVTVRATGSAGVPVDHVFSIHVVGLPVVAAPTTFTVAEGGAVGDVIGQLAVVPEVGFEGTAVWSVVSCTQASTCTTVGLSAGGTLSWLRSPNYEVKGSVSYQFTARVKNIGGLYKDVAVLVYITNVNEAPAMPAAADARTVRAGLAAGADLQKALKRKDICAVDPDASTVFTYTVTGDVRFGVTTDPATGCARIKTNAVLEYTPVSGMMETAVLSLSVCDGGSLCSDSEEVTVSICPTVPVCKTIKSACTTGTCVATVAACCP